MRVLLRSVAQPTGELRVEKPIEFHRRLPGYAVTPLIDAPRLACNFGVSSVVIKDETSRFGLPSFKILGASWAAYVVLRERLGPISDGRLSSDALLSWASPLQSTILVAATDGNHGRALARVAKWFGLGCLIFVPDFVSPARCKAIVDEGADLIVIRGNYDASVDAALEASNQGNRLLISDTARSTSDVGPRLVSDGYSTAFDELEQQFSDLPNFALDVVGVQAGVGGLAAAATAWARRNHSMSPARVVVSEPESAASVFTALAAGEPTAVRADQETAMAVLQCGTVSLTAFPSLNAGVSCCLAIDDSWALAAVSELHACHLETGPSGAAGLAGLMAALSGEFNEIVKLHLGIGRESRLLFIATESAAAAGGP